MINFPTMKSLLIFGLAFFCWFLSLGLFERAPMFSLCTTLLGGIICIWGLFVNHAEHTRRR